MRIYEIREYHNGGWNDRGFVIGYVHALDRDDAKIRYANIKNQPDVTKYGNYQAREVTKGYHAKQVEKAKENLLITNILN